MKLKQSHKQQQRFYKQTIQIFPSLKYPPLQSCKDYQESLSYQYHLAYLLGEVLSKADKDLFKGGYLKLNQEIKKAKQLYKIHQEYKEKLQELNLSYCFIPREYLLDSLFLLKEIKALMHKLKSQENNSLKIESFFSNLFSQIPFSTQTPFLVKHKQEILDWLNSKEFKEQYINTNHPYPSLLNPNKLNANIESKRIKKDSKNQENVLDKESKSYNEIKNSLDSKDIQPYPNLSYENISPELAWDLNLPLPRNYKFIFCLLHGAGTTAMTHYLRLCGIALNRHWGNGDYQYMEAYKLLLKSNKISGVIVSSSDFNHTRDKMIKLVDKQCPILSVFRDPISVLKPVINHLYGGYSKKPLTSFTLDTDIKSLFDFKLIRRFDKVCISDFLRKCCNETHKESIYYGNEFLIQATQFICIDMKEILPQKAFYTMQKLSKFFGFHIDSCIEDGFKRLINSNEEYDLRPLEGRKMMITIADKVIIIYFSKNEKFEKDFVECIHLFSQSNLIVSQFGLKAYISKDDFALLSNDKDIFVKVKDFLREYFIQAEQYRNENYNRLFDESKILELLRKDKKSSFSLRKALRMRYAYVIKKYPDIVESWKYYQEFERMCKELD